MTAHKLIGLALGLLAIVTLVVSQRYARSEVARYNREQRERGL